MSSRTVLLPAGPGAQPQVLRVDGGGLSQRGRTLAWILALVLLLTGAGALTAAGLTPITGERLPTTTGSGPVGGPGSSGSSGGAGGAAGTGSAAAAGDGTAGGATDLDGTVVEGAVVGEWDGPTVHLDWSGQRYTTVEADFVGDRVASPGDRVERTLTLRNAGPEDAVLSVDLLLDETVPAGSPNPGLGEAIDLHWDVAGVEGSEQFAVLHSEKQPTIAEVRVPEGGTVPVTVGFTMPASETGHRGGDDSTTLHFRVLAHLQGETGVDPAPVPPEPVDPEEPGPDGGLAVTGSHLLGAVLLLLGLLLAGWLLLALNRRRAACDVCGGRVDRGDRWTVHHAEDGSRTVECGDCWARPRLGVQDREQEPVGPAAH
ncbi:hypothetical protein [Cellulosimicrobium cellulans]|uniref:hypothetical protein n=1 Tax=Cellulosimicrobium cellulans TaxID=1710 RepID=UPI00130E018E|nr:hypothetical protein [Cellulosimicrobium cellulans]